jgi:hypothetical protein
MATHDFTAAISPGTLRISVLTDDETHVTDLPSTRLAEVLKAFEDFAGLDSSSTSCKAVAEEASEIGDAYMVGVAVLWLFLRLPEPEHTMNRERLDTIIRAGGGAMLAVTTHSREEDWKFRLYAMPSRPAGVRPSRPTPRDLKRRWR